MLRYKVNNFGIMPKVVNMMDLSILMPFYNEEKQIDITVRTILPILEELDISSDILLIDDGSSDHTWDEISKVSLAYPNQVRGLKLSRNFGKEAAICARCSDLYRPFRLFKVQKNNRGEFGLVCTCCSSGNRGSNPRCGKGSRSRRPCER